MGIEEGLNFKKKKPVILEPVKIDTTVEGEVEVYGLEAATASVCVNTDADAPAATASSGASATAAVSANSESKKLKIPIIKLKDI